MQDQFKKKKKKEKIKEVSVFNFSFLSVASAATIQNSSSNFQSSNAHIITDTVDTILADYDFYASFIVDNKSDSHVINYFY